LHLWQHLNGRKEMNDTKMISCGNCGELIKMKDIEKHVKDEHFDDG